MSVMEQSIDITELVYNKYIKDLVKEDSKGLYIIPGTLNFKTFTKNERLFINAILDAKKIKVRKSKPQKITKKDRSKRVSDLDIGTIKYHEMNDIDEPVKSTIVYDAEQRISFANFEELDTYLEEVVIPKYMQIRKTRTDEYGKDYHSIQLNHLVDLRLSEDELKHAIEFLADQGIIVCGKAIMPSDEFENYDYYVTNQTFKHGRRIDNQTLFAYFGALNSSKISNEERADIRHKIIEANTRIASYVVYRNGYKYNLPKEDLLSFSLEGLIEAVDNFDLNYGTSFFWYAYVCCLNRMKKEVAKDSKLPVNLFWKFQKGKKFVESANIKNYKPGDEDMLNEILEFLINMGEISLSDAKTIKKVEKAKANVSYDDYEEKISYENENSLFEKFSKALLREQLEYVLSTLTDRESKVLKLRFGLADGEAHTLEEVAERYDITRERVRQIEAKALRKLRHPSRSKKVKDFLDEDGSLYTDNSSMITSDSKNMKKQCGLDTYIDEETKTFEYNESALDDLYDYIETQEQKRKK